MLGRIPFLQLALQVGGHRVEVLLDARVHLVSLDDHPVEVVVEDVAHHADRHIRLALQQLGTLAVQELVTLGGDALPLVHQRLQILDDRLLGGTLGRRTDDHAHVLRRDLGDDALQTAALTLRELATDASHAAGGHQHQETARQRDLRGQTRTLVADRILGDLHEHRVAGLERQLDAARLALQTRGVPVHLAGVQHAVAGLADVHERGLHARQHVLHAAEIDVADGGDLLDVGHVVLDQDVVLDHRDLGMAFTFAHHHQAFHALAARQEILLHQLVLAAALAAVVAPTLLLGLQAGRALDIGDLVDVLLLARATNQRLLLLLLGLGTTTAATTTADGLLLVVVLVLTGGFAGMFLMLVTRPIVVRTLLAIAAARAATTATGRALLLVIGFGGTLLVDRQIGDVVELEVLLDLFDLGRGTTLLGVQTARTARRAGFLLRALLLDFDALLLTAPRTTGTGTTGRGTILLPVLLLVVMDGTGTRLRQHRLLEQQGGHRAGLTSRLMPLGQRGHRVERAIIARGVAERRMEHLDGFGLFGVRAATGATARGRGLGILASGLGRRLRLAPGRQMRLLEQRQRMILHLQRDGGAGGTHVTGDAAATAATRRGGFGR